MKNVWAFKLHKTLTWNGGDLLCKDVSLPPLQSFATSQIAPFFRALAPPPPHYS
jgi:hypothetical protein